jgi:hypothetical protein
MTVIGTLAILLPSSFEEYHDRDVVDNELNEYEADCYCNFPSASLPLDKRVQILSMLCEGSSMQSIGRVAEVSINTVCALLAAAGPVCTKFHDQTVRGVASKRIQCDEAWAFCYAKQKSVATAKAAPGSAGDRLDVDRTRRRFEADSHLGGRRARRQLNSGIVHASTALTALES